MFFEPKKLRPALREALIHVSRNGRWGDCVDCPRDSAGMRYPEFCKHTARYDHWLDPRRLLEQIRLELPDPAPTAPSEQPASQPKIPEGIYYNTQFDNFYTSSGSRGCGNAFHTAWRSFSHLFPRAWRVRSSALGTELSIVAMTPEAATAVFCQVFPTAGTDIDVTEN